MSNPSKPDFEVVYHAGIPGRAEFVRLMFEATGVTYRDAPQEDGQDCIIPYVTGNFADHDKNPLPFAVPVLRHNDVVISQVPNIVLYLSSRLPPIDLDGESTNTAQTPAPLHDLSTFHWLEQLMTILDMNNEVHETHHPIDIRLYYEDQKAEAQKRAQAFREARIPKFLGNFENNIKKHTSGFLNEKVSPADLALFHMVEGILFAFPERINQVKSEFPHVFKLRDTIKSSRRIQAYINSGRRIPFNNYGIFRHYTELDGEVPKQQ
ncbi:hypothetical protein OIO90_000270 [Microbotryomycetes sp. JL221]|nr:hypothetical protein OIO90_000270 [Microbotryomycetes sp. JL221]